MAKEKKKKKNPSKAVIKKKYPSNVVAEKNALKRIKDNIENIYENANVQKKTLQARRDHNISDGLYNNYKNEVSKIRSIYKLINFLKKKWIDQSLRNKEVAKVIDKRIAELNITLEIQDKHKAKEITKTFKRMYFLEDVIKTYMNGISMFVLKMNINPEIWKSVIVAMLFNVPKEKVLGCKESILKDYLPSIVVNDDFIRILIHELTTQNDIKLIWKKIRRKQKEYKKKHRYIISEREYTSRDNDKIIEDLCNKKLSDAEIVDELEKKGIKGYTKYKIRDRRREIKKRNKQT